jgi:predicted HicB family RNase H-like nuclease
MELTPYLENLQRDVAAAAAAGGELLGSTIQASGRLCLLEALSDAAAEITTKLESASVEVRLHGREAQFVVAHRDVIAGSSPASTEPGPAVDVDGDIARITLRLPESIKEAVEAAAATATMSVNGWLVRAISAALAGPSPARPADMPERSKRRFTGYAQA